MTALRQSAIMELEKSYGAEYIVTRNVSDYSKSDIKAIIQSEYLGLQ